MAASSAGFIARVWPVVSGEGRSASTFFGWLLARHTRKHRFPAATPPCTCSPTSEGQNDNRLLSTPANAHCHHQKPQSNIRWKRCVYEKKTQTSLKDPPPSHPNLLRRSPQFLLPGPLLPPFHHLRPACHSDPRTQGLQLAVPPGKRCHQDARS